jgi:hypothetical protein
VGRGKTNNGTTTQLAAGAIERQPGPTIHASGYARRLNLFREQPVLFYRALGGAKSDGDRNDAVSFRLPCFPFAMLPVMQKLSPPPLPPRQAGPGFVPVYTMVSGQAMQRFVRVLLYALLVAVPGFDLTNPSQRGRAGWRDRRGTSINSRSLELQASVAFSRIQRANTTS